MSTSHVSEPWHADYWNGPAGERWARYQEQMDRALHSFGRAMLAAAELRPGDRVLDVGCGCGGTTLDAATATEPRGVVVGVDVSKPMLRLAQHRGATRSGLQFVEGDAASYRFDTRFDAIVSRFGLTFFADPQGAFRHLHGCLAPGGRLRFVCWREIDLNEWLSVPLNAVRSAFDYSSPSGSPQEPGPFAFADLQYMTRTLSSAGFGHIEVSELNRSVVLSSNCLAEAVELVSVHAGPVGRLFAAANAGQRAVGLQLLENALRPYLKDGAVRMRGSAWLVSATTDP